MCGWWVCISRTQTRQIAKTMVYTSRITLPEFFFGYGSKSKCARDRYPIKEEKKDFGFKVHTNNAKITQLSF